MPNGKDSPLTPEKIRQQVDQIMGRWQSYPSFAALFDDLMEANALSDRKLAEQLTRQIGRNIRYYVANCPKKDIH